MEDLLHYVWRNRLFAPTALTTTDGRPLKIIFPGMAHQDAGPDFKQAVIKIGDLTWAGDVEIHVNSSDWHRHKHSADPKYQSVILHVVYRHDAEIERMPGEEYATLELRRYIPESMLEKYKSLTLSTAGLPCQQQLKNIEPVYINSFFMRLTTERLLRKQEGIMGIHESCRHDWNETAYRIIARSYGFSTNATGFELLAQSLPFRILYQHHDSRTQLYALLFGQAGMLEREPCDDYYRSLQDEYTYLKYKYKLTPIPEKCWLFLRMRPNNFPTIRLAQLAELIFHHPNLFADLTRFENKEQCYRVFGNEPHEYWQKHYLFGKESKKHCVTPGASTIDLLLINNVVPILFAYGNFCGDATLQEKALDILEQLHFEQNHITRKYQEAGFPCQNASHSQAFLELQKYYCTPKKCLQCQIGVKIIGER